jgi:8-oxo-dGTP pyrophosphatase MutT (NUDIX family)
LLLIQVQNLSGSKVWTFPKGHLEKGETSEQAALREVFEETGWRCRVVEPVMDVKYIYSHQDIYYRKTVTWFLMEPIKKEGEFSPQEVLACRWVPRDEAEKIVQYDSDKKLLSKLKSLSASH